MGKSIIVFFPLTSLKLWGFSLFALGYHSAIILLLFCYYLLVFDPAFIAQNCNYEMGSYINHLTDCNPCGPSCPTICFHSNLPTSQGCPLVFQQMAFRGSNTAIKANSHWSHNFHEFVQLFFEASQLGSQHYASLFTSKGKGSG